MGSLHPSHPRQWLYSPGSHRTTCWPAPMLLSTSALYYYPAAPAWRGRSRAAAPQNNGNAGLGRKVVGTVLSAMPCFDGPVLPAISLRPNHRLSPFRHPYALKRMVDRGKIVPSTMMWSNSSRNVIRCAITMANRKSGCEPSSGWLFGGVTTMTGDSRMVA